MSFLRQGHKIKAYRFGRVCLSANFIFETTQWIFTTLDTVDLEQNMLQDLILVLTGSIQPLLYMKLKSIFTRFLIIYWG